MTRAARISARLDAERAKPARNVFRLTGPRMRGPDIY
jgi:hypothetical protein